MEAGKKWKELKLYLENKDKQLITELRSDGRAGNMGSPGLAGKLALIDDILTQVERLDHDADDVGGCPAPPVHKY